MRLARRLADAARSPVRLVALARRIVELLLRGELGGTLARLRARGATTAELRAWRAACPVPRGEAAPFVLLLDVDDPPARLAGLGPEAAQARAVLRRDGANAWRDLRGGEARPLDAWCTGPAAVPWLWWVAAPLALADGAGAALAAACAQPGARIVTTDHDVVDGDGRLQRVAFAPAFDAFGAREAPPGAAWLAVHASLAAQVEAAAGAGAAGPWRVLLDAAAALPAQAVVHLPWSCVRAAGDGRPDAAAQAAVRPVLERAAEAAGVRVDVAPGRAPWLRYACAPRLASVVVPTRDRPDLLAASLEAALAHRGRHDVELVVVDNDSTDPAVAGVAAALRGRAAVTMLPQPGPFNFAASCNAGARAARGDVLVLLNNDAVASAGWLDELVALAVQPDVGAVGPLLVYPDGRLQSAGVLVGVNRTATSALAGFDPDDPFARAWCATRRRVSAVLGACLAVERRKYAAVGGMDERFAVSHNEVDLCLRLEAAGWSNVFTPFARVAHREGASRGFELTPDERVRLEREEAHFVARWGALLRQCDPAYHPALAAKGGAFMLGPPGPPPAPRAGWRAAATAPPAAAP